MKYKLLSVFCISFILLFVFKVKTVAIENKDNNSEMSDERVIEIIKEISDFMDSREKLGVEISYRESDGYHDYYFENPEDDEKLYIYHRDYIKDEAYHYLCKMYDIGFYRGRNTQSGESRSGLSNYMYYKIDTNGKFYLKNRDEKNICVQIQFIKSEILAENMPQISEGEVYFELCEDNKWRISKVSQWLNDLAYYDLGYEMKVFFDPEYNSLLEYEEFIEKYSYDSKGNRISMYISTDDNDEIFHGSDTELISESSNLEKLKKLSKLAACMAREEIYARHGKIYPKFSTEFNYFIRKIWYEKNENFSENDLSDIEKENIKIISEYIKSF
ncbi:YARHG domain-containing protein [Lachnoanaerobaculum saburreum]|jgi:hypothetical protein|uniref:YARHG domain-containing protein n=1 Tax=Lachnoanaerobaculum saburreum DSM 3986 TaxID=887325 RepID=E6LKY8_9FIRM|nr:YARHG domain-containing protein [Lachnoanaerobaculum saburreum]EFU77534.1 hypothetical protein HMPREF0381_0623 [Lachnoanaerobaculum saburreum DSM 3986]